MAIEDIIKSLVVQAPAIAILLVFVVTLYRDWKDERSFYKAEIAVLSAEILSLRKDMEHHVHP